MTRWEYTIEGLRSPNGCRDSWLSQACDHFVISDANGDCHSWMLQDGHWQFDQSITGYSISSLTAFDRLSGERILAGTFDALIYEIDPATWRMERLPVPLKNWAQTIECSPDGTKLLVMGFCGTVAVLDLETRRLLWHQILVSEQVHFGNGYLYRVAMGGEEVTIHDIATGAQLERFQLPRTCWDFQISDDGSMVGLSFDGPWLLREKRLIDIDEYNISLLARSTSNDYFAAEIGGSLGLIHEGVYKRAQMDPPHHCDIVSISARSNGFLTAGRDGSIGVWSDLDGTPLGGEASFEMSPGPILAVTAREDSLAFVFGNGEVRAINATTGRLEWSENVGKDAVSIKYISTNRLVVQKRSEILTLTHNADNTQISRIAIAPESLIERIYEMPDDNLALLVRDRDEKVSIEIIDSSEGTRIATKQWPHEDLPVAGVWWLREDCLALGVGDLVILVSVSQECHIRLRVINLPQDQMFLDSSGYSMGTGPTGMWNQPSGSLIILSGDDSGIVVMRLDDLDSPIDIVVSVYPLDGAQCPVAYDPTASTISMGIKSHVYSIDLSSQYKYSMDIFVPSDDNRVKMHRLHRGRIRYLLYVEHSILVSVGEDGVIRCG